MEQVAYSTTVPIQSTAEGIAGRAAASGSADFWPSLLMTIALSSIAIGITWDISWNVPAVGSGCLLVRNDLEAVCYKLPLLQP